MHDIVLYGRKAQEVKVIAPRPASIVVVISQPKAYTQKVNIYLGPGKGVIDRARGIAWPEIKVWIKIILGEPIVVS
jgi:hypothetical protein